MDTYFIEYPEDPEEHNRVAQLVDALVISCSLEARAGIVVRSDDPAADPILSRLACNVLREKKECKPPVLPPPDPDLVMGGKTPARSNGTSSNASRKGKKKGAESLQPHDTQVMCKNCGQPTGRRSEICQRCYNRDYQRNYYHRQKATKPS